MGDAKLVLDGEFNPSSILGSVRQIQGAFNGLKLPTNMTGNMIKDFDKLKEVMTKIKDLSNKQTFNNADMKSLNKLSSQADSLFSKISNSMDELSGKQIYLEADMTKIKAVETELDNIKAKIQSELSNLKINMDAGGVTKSLGMDQIVADMEKGVRSSKVLSAAMQDAKQAITAGDFSKAGQIFSDIEQKAVSLKGAGSGLLETFRQWGVISFQGPAKDITDTQTKADLLSKAMTQLITQLNTSNGGQVFKDLNKDLSDTTNKLENVKRAAEANYANSMKGLAGQVRDTGQAASKTTDEMKRMGQSTLDAANQIKQLQQSTQYFFGLRNMINLLRRGVTQAIDTIKELDKAMTQTAVVVPEWDVGDMWAKLPEYTKNANELGASVVDLYKATTLYYQQGLRGNEVMDVAAETMKMARIGGLDAADATDKMTAALRGFNMEVNQESAQRINDVYSNLAANSASNTEELGTAMQRTASIAASAGMSFEGTSAFLAQAIETTREPAENLGTAMKTIIARFTELKKNPLEITDVDGEEVSYNKVDTALQSIGVSLKDTNGQFRDLDQVFLDISQRWDSLTQTQQRYIATTAAGSRQQSRFIAMMSNYKRTQELMGFANNSEGASQKQFDKTLESFEVKITKLRNAWDKFLMGITDNTFIKGAVDGLTALIGGIGTLIDKLSGGIGPVKSFMSLMTAFVGLKMGGRLINSLIGGLGGMVDPTSSFTGGFHAGITGRGNPTLASQIYTPIVNAINGLKGTTNGTGAITTQQQQYRLYKDAVGNIKGLGNNFKTNDLLKNLTGDKNTQNAIMSRFSGSFKAVTNSMMSRMTKSAVKFNGGKDDGISSALKQGESYLANQRKLGEISAREYYNSLKDPALMQDALRKSGVAQNNPAVQYLQKTNDEINKQAMGQATKALPGIQEKVLKAYDEQIAKGRTFNYSREDLINRMNSAEYKQRLTNAKRANIINGLRDTSNQLTLGQRFENGFKQIGGAMTSAGMGLQSLGSTLQNSANPAVAAFGTTLSSMGGILTSAGMAVNGLTAAVTTVVGAIGIVPAAILAAVAALYIWKKHQEKVTKERAEEITKTYKDQSKASEKNVNNLNTWKEELPRLSKGVDANGNNVNLDSGDYQHYLEIVDEIAKLNPEIVKGYNAQGHAIIDNNTALEKTLELEKERQQQNIKDYTSKDAMAAMVAARDLNREAQPTEGMKGAGWRGAQARQRTSKDIEYKLSPQIEMETQAKEMARVLKENGFSDKDFKSLGISLDALEEGNAQAVAALQRNIDGFTAHSQALMAAAGDDLADDAEDTFNKATEGFSKSADKLDEMVTPVYEQLSAKMTADGVLDKIPEDMATFFNQGLKSIAANANLSSEEMISESNELATKFTDLTAKGTEYDKVMSDIAEAQEAFGEDLDTGAYEKAADSAVKSLEKIKDGVDSTSSYGQALTEFLNNQIAQISSFTEEGAVSVTEALNTMTDEITAAEGALESFKKVEEGSNFSTAAEGMKEIYNSITEKGDNGINKHAEGQGDQTYWAGAEALLGRDNLKKKSKEEVDKMLKTIEPMLEEGGKGFSAFYDRWISKQDELKKIGGVELFDENSKRPGWLKELDVDLNPDVYKQVADTLNISEDMLTSMLNKGRQFGALDFTNLDKVREGLATSDSIIRGVGSDVKGKRNMYIKQEALNAEFSAAGINSVAEQEKFTRQLEKEQGVKIISEAAKIGIEEFKDMGIHSQESLIATLDATGQYTKDEIQKYAETYAKVDKNAKKFSKEDFDAQFKAHEATKDPVAGEQLKSLESLDTTVATIADILSNQRLEEGHLDKSLAKEAKKMLYGEKGVMDTEAQQFAVGKNAEGDLISRKEYTETSKNLDSFITETDTLIGKLEQGRDEAKKRGDQEEVDKFDKEIAAFTKMLKDAKDYREKGKEAYGESNDQKIAEINKTNKNLLKGKTQEDFKGAEKGDALDSIYQASLEPLTKITDSFVEDLDTLDISLEKAQKKGLVTKEAYDAYVAQQEKDLEQQEAEKAAHRKEIHKETNANIDQINEKTGGALEGKTWKDFKGKDNRAAVEEVAQATQEPIQIITDSFVNSLNTVGLDLEQALSAGLVTQGAYDVWKQNFLNKDKEYEQARADAEAEAQNDPAAIQKVQERATEQARKEQEAKDKAAEMSKQQGEQARLEQEQRQKEAAERARIAAEQRDRENEEKLRNAKQGDAFDQYTPEEAQKAGQNLKDWWNNLFKSFKMDTSKNALGFSSEDIDTSGLDDAAKGAENAANGAKAASDELEKNKNSITNVASAVTSGLNYANKGVKTFVQNAKEASSPSLQGKPKEKGTTIPGVGYVVNGKPAASPKKDEKQPGVGDQTVTLKINADYTQVGEAKKAVNSTIKLTKKPARLFVNATIGKNIGKAQAALNTLKQSSGQKVSSSVKVSSTGDTSGVKTITKAASSAKSSVLVTANTAPAYQKINALISSINGKTANVDVNVWPHYKGTWKKEVIVSEKKLYTGQNNTGIVPQLPNLGSLAGGTSKPGIGRLGPKGRGGLTLTGELGYEVAWLPREGRSMILGAKGPEMVNLPGDAVVWNHEQSKQIIKKNQIPSGSAAIGAGSAGDTNGYDNWKLDSSSSVYSGGTVTKRGKVTPNKQGKKNSKSTEKILKQTWKLLNTAGKISNWWEDISRQVEGAQRISDRNQKAFKKLIDTAGTTLKDVQASAKTYAKSLQNTITLNQKIVDTYTKQLKKLDNGSGSTKQRNAQRKKINKASNKVTKAQAKVELAEKTKSKKDDKKAKKALKKAKKALKTAKKKNKKVDTVTYDDTILTTTIKKVKGKKKKVKSKEKVKSTRAVDWSSIIKYDAKNDTWVLNDKAINKQAGGNKNAAKAIKEKGNKLIDEKISRRNAAQDKIDAAKEALDQLAEDTYNMFNRWEKSITEIYFISQQLERLQKRSDIYSAQEEYLSAKAKAGYNPEDALDRLTQVLTNERNNLVEQAKANSALVDHTFKQYQDALTLESYILNNNGADANGGTSLASQNEIEAANIVFQVMKDLGLDSPETFNRSNLEKAVSEYRAKNYTNTTDEEVKKVIDRIAEYEGAYLDAIKETYSSVTEIYAKLDEYREFVNDFEESLLKGLEEELNDEIDRQEKLNSALTDAFKDLLDEVKRRLDQRRQAEDNAKTESDIAKKQQRLAVLRADTSGGHASEIKQLEQELADAQQSYGRTLEDQLLERLQDQGDKAAEQRERQIKLLEIQRDLAQALGTNLEEVKKWLDDPEHYKEQIKQAWLANRGYDEALPDEQQSLLRQFEEEWTKYGAYAKSIEAYEEILDRVNEVGGKSPVEDIETSVSKIETELGGLVKSLKDEGWIHGDFNQNVNAEGNTETAHINTEGTIENIKKLKKQGLNPQEIKDKGKEAGIEYSYAQLKEAGFSAKDFKNAGINAYWAAKAGFNYKELTSDGAYTYEDILKHRDKISGLENGAKIVNSAHKAEIAAIVKKDKEAARQQFLNELKQAAKQIDPNNPTGIKKNGVFASVTSILGTKGAGSLSPKDFKGTAIPMKSGSGHIHKNGKLYFNDSKGNVRTFDFTTGKFGKVSFDKKKWEKHAGYKQDSDTPYIKSEFQQALKKRDPKTYKKFAQGGLATTTGPAWLDGTRAKPELVLNATDTKNFIALKDVLSNVMNGVNSMTDMSDVQGAPVTYDININVDHLNNDYDVDRVADRVKKIIVQDASYRNVTAVRKFR